MEICTQNLQGVFSGPYLVTGHLVSSLIHYGKLRPSVASSNNFLTNKEPVKISLEGKKSLEVFSALFLGKGKLSLLNKRELV